MIEVNAICNSMDYQIYLHCFWHNHARRKEVR